MQHVKIFNHTIVCYPSPSHKMYASNWKATLKARDRLSMKSEHISNKENL